MPAYKDGKTWRYRTRVTLPSGLRKRIGGTPKHANTKKAAEAAERAHIHRLLNPSAPALNPAKEVPTLEEYTKRWLKHYAKGKPSDIDAKNQMLDAYIRPRLGKVQLDAITQEHIDDLVLELLVGRSRKTVNNILSAVSSLVRHAVRSRVISDPNLLCHIETTDTELVAVPMADVGRLLAVADERYRVAILLAAEAGLRIGEVRGLRREDINQVHRQLSIVQSVDTKGRVVAPKHWKGRKVPISDRLWGALKALPERPRRLLRTKVAKDAGDTPLTYWAMRDGILELYKRSGVTVPPQPWHCLRHTFGTEMARAGVPVTTLKDLMGHRSIQTTLRYIHTDDGARADAIRMAFGQHMAKDQQEVKEKPR